jgi:hypothetical protein
MGLSFRQAQRPLRYPVAERIDARWLSILNFRWLSLSKPPTQRGAEATGAKYKSPIIGHPTIGLILLREAADYGWILNMGE